MWQSFNWKCAHHPRAATEQSFQFTNPPGSLFCDLDANGLPHSAGPEVEQNPCPLRRHPIHFLGRLLGHLKSACCKTFWVKEGSATLGVWKVEPLRSRKFPLQPSARARQEKQRTGMNTAFVSSFLLNLPFSWYDPPPFLSQLNPSLSQISASTFLLLIYSVVWNGWACNPTPLASNLCAALQL